MPETVIADGSQAATVPTEHTLYTIAVPGRYRLAVDLSVLVGGATPDVVELRGYTNVLDAGTERVVMRGVFVAGQVIDLNQESDWFSVLKTGKVTLNQLIGTTRTFPWAVLREGGPIGSVTTDAGNSATAFETDLASAVNDYYKDAYLRILTGTLAGQVKKVSAYTGATKIITLASALTGTPADGTDFEIINA